MGERRLGTVAGDLATAALRCLELAVVVGAVGLIVAVLFGALFHRGVGEMAVLVCSVTGAGMMASGFMRDPNLAPRNKRRSRRAQELEEERLCDPAYRARAEIEALKPRSFVSTGGVTAAAGLLVVLTGFFADGIIGG